MRDLETLRKEIDTIDNQMKALFIQRMQIAKEVGLHKKANNLPILNEKRELEMIQRHKEMFGNDELWSFYESFLKHIMALSKEIQK